MADNPVKPAPRIAFESQKIAMSQNRDGFVLTLRIHPDDLNMELLRLPVGTKFGVVMVELGDDGLAIGTEQEIRNDEEEQKQEALAKRKYSSLMGQLCSSNYLLMYLEDGQFETDEPEEAVSQIIKENANSESWRDKLAALNKIADKVREYARPNGSR